MPGHITSRENETVKYACKIAQEKDFRYSENCFFAEGVRLCTDLLSRPGGAQARALFCTRALLEQQGKTAQELETATGASVYEVEPHVAAKLAQTKTPQGMFGLFTLEHFGVEHLRAGGRYLCLENVQDPGNVGAMLRSAAAFGFSGVLCVGETADPFSPKAVRASMGAAGVLPVLPVQSSAEAMQALCALGIPSHAATLSRDSVSFRSLVPGQEGLALWIGNEGNGLGPETVRAAQVRVHIPMTNHVESLNAATAASILLCHFGTAEQ